MMELLKIVRGVKMKRTKIRLCDEDACYCMGSIECLEELEEE